MSSLLVIFAWGGEAILRFWICESGQKLSVNLLQNMFHSTLQHPPSPPPTVTHCLYTIYCTLGRGEEVREKVRRGATVHKYSSFVHGGNSSQAGLKNTNHDWMYLQSIKSVKQNAAKSVNRSTERKATYRVWCLYSSFVHGSYQSQRRKFSGGFVSKYFQN